MGVVYELPLAIEVPPVGKVYQLMVPVPLTVSVVVFPEQTVWFAAVVVLLGAAGVAFTVTVIGVKAELHPVLLLVYPT